MPYLKQSDRRLLLPITNAIQEAEWTPDCPGDLNYLFTVICLHYLAANGTSYQRFNDIIGALEGAKLELYRRQVAAYEDSKIAEHGDVY